MLVSYLLDNGIGRIQGRIQGIISVSWRSSIGTALVKTLIVTHILS